MFKFLFELLTDSLGLPVHWAVEYVLMAIIGAIAFGVGWDVSPGGPLGSLIHFVVRAFVFVALWLIMCGLIWLVKWIISNWLLIIGIVVAIVLVIGIVVLIIHHISSRS